MQFMLVIKNHQCSFFKFYEMNAFDINAVIKDSLSFLTKFCFAK